MKNNLFILILLFSQMPLYGMTNQIQSSYDFKYYEAPNKIHKDDIKSQPLFNSKILQLDEVLKYSLVNNPMMRMKAWQLRAKKGYILDAALWENPVVETELENLGVDEISILMSLEIPLGGKVINDVKISQAEYRIAEFEYEMARLELIVSQSKEFYSIVKTKQELNLYNQLSQTAQDAYDISEKRYKAGAASIIDFQQAKKTLHSIVLQKRMLENTLKFKLDQMSILIGGKLGVFTNIDTSLDSPSAIPGIDSILNDLSNTPAIIRWTLQNQLLKSMKNSAISEAIPDLEVTAGYKRVNTTSESAVILSAALELPLWNFNQGEIRESKINLHVSKYDRKLVEISLRNELQLVYLELLNTFQEIETLNSNILPILDKNYSEGYKMYRNGTISMTELLIFQNELLESQFRELELLHKLKNLELDMELILGKSLDFTSKEK